MASKKDDNIQVKLILESPSGTNIENVKSAIRNKFQGGKRGDGFKVKVAIDPLIKSIDAARARITKDLGEKFYKIGVTLEDGAIKHIRGLINADFKKFFEISVKAMPRSLAVLQNKVAQSVQAGGNIRFTIDESSVTQIESSFKNLMGKLKNVDFEKLRLPDGITARYTNLSNSLDNLYFNLLRIESAGSRAAPVLNALSSFQPIKITFGAKAVSNIRAFLVALIDLGPRIEQFNRIVRPFIGNLHFLADALERVRSGIKGLPPEMKKANKALKQTQNQAAQTGASVSTLGQQIGATARRFTVFLATASIFRVFQSNVRDAVSEALEFQDAMVRISQVGQVPISIVKQLSETVRELAVDLGVSSKELINVGASFAQAGFNIEQTQKLLEITAKADLAPTFKDMASTADGLIAVFNQFGGSIDELESKFGSINAIARAFPTDAEDIIKAVRKGGGAFAQSGGTFEEFIALFTSVRSNTRETADTIGTAFRTIFPRLQRTRTIKFLRDFDIELEKTDERGNRIFVGPLEAIRRIQAELERFEPGDTRLAQVQEQVGGLRQIAKVIPLLSNLEQAEKALLVAQLGRESLEEDAIIRRQAVIRQLTSLKEAFLEVVFAIGSSDEFKALISGTIRFTNQIIKLVDALTPLIPLLLTLTGIKAGQALSGAAGQFFGGIAGRRGQTKTSLSSIAPVPVRPLRAKPSRLGRVAGIGGALALGSLAFGGGGLAADAVDSVSEAGGGIGGAIIKSIISGASAGVLGGASAGAVTANPIAIAITGIVAGFATAGSTFIGALNDLEKDVRNNNIQKVIKDLTESLTPERAAQAASEGNLSDFISDLGEGSRKLNEAFVEELDERTSKEIGTFTRTATKLGLPSFLGGLSDDELSQRKTEIENQLLDANEIGVTLRKAVPEIVDGLMAVANNFSGELQDLLDSPDIRASARTVANLTPNVSFDDVIDKFIVAPFERSQIEQSAREISNALSNSTNTLQSFSRALSEANTRANNILVGLSGSEISGSLSQTLEQAFKTGRGFLDDEFSLALTSILSNIPQDRADEIRESVNQTRGLESFFTNDLPRIARESFSNPEFTEKLESAIRDNDVVLQNENLVRNLLEGVSPEGEERRLFEQFDTPSSVRNTINKLVEQLNITGRDELIESAKLLDERFNILVKQMNRNVQSFDALNKITESLYKADTDLLDTRRDIRQRRAFDSRGRGGERTQIDSRRQDLAFELSGSRDIRDITRRLTEIIGDELPEQRALAQEVGADTTVLTNLTLEAQNLRAAFDVLADRSEQLAASQNRLNELNKEEQSRFGLFERLVSASGDPAEVAEINRAVASFGIFADRLENTGRGFDVNTSPEFMRQVFQGASLLGDVPFRGRNPQEILQEGLFAGGSPLGQVLPGLLRGNLALPPGAQVERQQVETDIIADLKLQREALVAQQKLITAEKDSNNTIFSKAVQQFSDSVKSLFNGGERPANRALGGSIFKRQGRDTVPAMLEPGEFVVSKKGVEGNRSLLEQINQGKVQKFQRGGPVRGNRLTMEEILKQLRENAQIHEPLNISTEEFEERGQDVADRIGLGEFEQPRELIQSELLNTDIETFSKNFDAILDVFSGDVGRRRQQDGPAAPARPEPRVAGPAARGGGSGSGTGIQNIVANVGARRSSIRQPDTAVQNARQEMLAQRRADRQNELASRRQEREERPERLRSARSAALQDAIRSGASLKERKAILRKDLDELPSVPTLGGGAAPVQVPAPAQALPQQPEKRGQGAAAPTKKEGPAVQGMNFAEFGVAVNTFNDAVDNFVPAANTLSEALDKFASMDTIKLEGLQNVDITINGTETLKAIQENVKASILDSISERIDELKQEIANIRPPGI